MRHKTVYRVVAALALTVSTGLPVAGQDVNPQLGCNQREYVYAGGRLLALVDSAPGITLGFAAPASVAVAESAGTVTLTVTLSEAAACPVSVGFATQDGTATAADSDFVPASGLVNFLAGVTTRTFPVTIGSDTKYEPNETFTVLLFNPTGGTIGGVFSPSFTLTILNDDQPPSVSIGATSLPEGNGGSTSASFPVTLSAMSGFDTDVHYTTSDGTALANSDYGPVVGGLVHIPAGQPSGAASVPVFGDNAYEADETFTVTLSNPVNATILAGQAQGTIQNDDPPGILISDVMANEGNLGTTPFQFGVTLQGPAAQTVTVQYQTADATAVAGSDYTAKSGTVTFAPYVLSQPLNVDVLGDAGSEGWEYFLVNLSSATGAPIVDGQGRGSIRNDDAPIAAGLPRADFDLDGDTDVLFRHALSGKLVTWLMNGIDRNTGLFLNPDQLADLNWKLEGTADLGSLSGSTLGPPDGKTDIVWRHDVSGRVVIWMMDGINRTGGVFATPDLSSGPAWKIVGTGSFSGRFGSGGIHDLLWWNNSTGALEVWAMNGTTRIGSPTAVVPDEPDLTWQVVGTGDATGEGHSDIWWRKSDGSLRVWQMRGATRIATLTPNPAQVADLNWKFLGTPDLDRDGKPDILWRHDVSANLVVWLMNGVNRTTGLFLNPSALADPNWKVAGPR